MTAARPRLSASIAEAARLAWESLRSQPARSALAIGGVVIGIVTVVLVASVLVGLRNSVAQLFRELGTDNIFAFHRNGDPYTPASDRDALRRPLSPAFAETIARLGPAVRDVGAQLLVPAVTATRTITARAGGNESDAVLIEGVSPNFFDITGAEFAAGRPFGEVENRVAAPVAVLGANVADALFGPGDAVGQPFLLGGERYYVVGVLARRKGTFFGENRNDNVV
jgi:putative ABC transport system permease protein